MIARGSAHPSASRGPEPAQPGGGVRGERATVDGDARGGGQPQAAPLDLLGDLVGRGGRDAVELAGEDVARGAGLRGDEIGRVGGPAGRREDRGDPAGLRPMADFTSRFFAIGVTWTREHGRWLVLADQNTEVTP